MAALWNRNRNRKNRKNRKNRNFLTSGTETGAITCKKLEPELKQ
jgi:hypothetical protein